MSENHDDQVGVNWPVVMMVGGLGLFMFFSVLGTLAWLMMGGTV